MVVEFPKRRESALQDQMVRAFDGRKADTTPEAFARVALAGFFDVCMHTGLDRVLEQLGVTDFTDRAALADRDEPRLALAAQLEVADLDGGGPRNAKPRRIVDALISGLGLTVVEEPDRAIALDDAVRKQVIAALATVLDVELAAEKLRETVIAEAKARIDERFHTPFNRMAAQLDANGMQLIKQPKVPLDAQQAAQQALFEARMAIVERAARAALERAKEVLVRADADAAARLDQPIALRLTPRDVAILRANTARVMKTPALVALSLLESLVDLIPITWRVAERVARPYAASQTFSVGELIGHPKFGEGTVTATLDKRIDVEFADGLHTLVHVPPLKGR